MKTKNIKKLLFVFLVASFFVLVIVPGTRAIFSEKETTKINLNIETPTYTVTFDGNGGTSSVASKEVAYLHEYGELPLGEKCGSTFLGWYTGLDTGTKIEEDSIFDLTNEQTLYARYSNNKELYDVMKCETERTDILNANKLTQVYTGVHQDSMDETLSTNNIYIWTNKAYFDTVYFQDANNVIFADQCWKIIRTTDTGGVKLLYYGEAVDGKCLNTRENHAGYNLDVSYKNLGGTYYYGTGYVYDQENNNFYLSGTVAPVEVTTSNGPSVIPNLKGQYTCLRTTEEATCETIYMIDKINGSTGSSTIPINNNSLYAQFGRLRYNLNNTSLSDVGYMYNARYEVSTYDLNKETPTPGYTFNSNFVFADSFSYNLHSDFHYELDNPDVVSDINDVVGKYTFFQDSSVQSHTTVYYVTAVKSNIMYYIPISGGNTSFDNYTYTYGPSYRTNNDGTYTINDATTIHITEWPDSSSSVKGNYVCKNAVDDTCSDLWYTDSTSNTSIVYSKRSNVIKYANGFNYICDENNENCKYHLNDDSVSFFEVNTATRTSLNTHHYTCFNASGECDTISFIFYAPGTSFSYINIKDGKSIEYVIEEMLSLDNDNYHVNEKDSLIKKAIEAWYKNFIYNDYDEYVEDVIYCNDRTIGLLNGWNKNGNLSENYLAFTIKSDDTGLSCANETDKFSVSNDKAKLSYKVGLATVPETEGVYHYLSVGYYYWLLTPNEYKSSQAIVLNNYYSTLAQLAVRPTLSLKPGIKYTSGNGSMATPYIIDYNN